MPFRVQGSTSNPIVARPRRPTVTASTRPTLNLQAELSNPDSALSVAIGNAEGTRTVSGGRTAAYSGHEDPGNGAWNAGTFSYQVKQGGAGSPAEADRVPRMNAIADVLKVRGLLDGSAPASDFSTTPAAPSSGLAGADLLRTGSTGPEVSRLQEQLNASGAQLDVDGDYGVKTEAAVHAFQRKRNLTEDGVVGPDTRAALSSGSSNSTITDTGLHPSTLDTAGYKQSFEIRPGSTGPKVKELKQALKDAGFYPGVVSDQMGPDGVAALKRAKEALKLGGAADVAGDFTLAKVKAAAKEKAQGTITAGNFTVDQSNAALRALANGRLAEDETGYCVRATLNNMERLGVRQPDATGLDNGNNPRGGMVQLVRNFGCRKRFRARTGTSRRTSFPRPTTSGSPKPARFPRAPSCSRPDTSAGT